VPVVGVVGSGVEESLEQLNTRAELNRIKLTLFMII